MDEYNICDNFLDNPNLNPEKFGSKLQRGAGPYRKYIARCQKLGGNHKVRADKLLSELEPKSNIVIPNPMHKSNIPIPSSKLVIPTPIPKLTTQTKISVLNPIHKSNIPKSIIRTPIPKLMIRAQIPIHESNFPKSVISIPIVSESTDIYNIYPAEIWNHILLDLNCKTAKSICLSSQQLNKLCKDNDIIEKTRHCAAFDVSEIISEKYDISKMKINEYNGKEYEKNPYYLFEYRDAMLDAMLDKLYELNFDLVRGDLICFEGLDADRNEGIYIFDGCKIMDLDHEIDDYGALPSEFTVINNGVPIDYWHNIDPYNAHNEGDYIKGINHNNIVWFDAKSVKNQLINNISYSNESNGPSTTFMYNNINYIMDIEKFSLEVFTKILSSDDKLLFDNEENYYPEYDYFDNSLHLPSAHKLYEKYW